MNNKSNEKYFTEWIGQKQYLHNVNHTRSIHEGEIWWCAIGENVGVEINGKSKVFSRPVLVFKKLSRFSQPQILKLSKMAFKSCISPINKYSSDQTAEDGRVFPNMIPLYHTPSFSSIPYMYHASI